MGISSWRAEILFALVIFCLLSIVTPHASSPCWPRLDDITGALGRDWPDLMTGDQREIYIFIPLASFLQGSCELATGFLDRGNSPVSESAPHSSGFWKHLPSLVPSNLALLFTAQSCTICLGFPIPCPCQINSSFIKLSSDYPIRVCHLVPARPLPNTVFYSSLFPQDPKQRLSH